MTTRNVVVLDFVPLLAIYAMVKLPSTLGVPEIVNVLASKESPLGSQVT